MDSEGNRQQNQFALDIHWTLNLTCKLAIAPFVSR